MKMFTNQADLEVFMWTLCRIVPADQLPNEIVFEESELEFVRGNSWAAPSKHIHFRSRAQWVAEQKCRDRITLLESRIAALEKEKLL